LSYGISDGEGLNRHGRPVARILPAAPTTGAPLLDRLIAQGSAIAVNAGPIPSTPARGDDETGSLSAALAEMRDDERY
jgi:antitoxin (DNA-binding transcriptional repressor) of toxin-antitoxin stability system